MDDQHIPNIVGGCTLLIILAVSSFFSAERRNLRAIGKHKRVSIADVKEGEIVSIQGTIQPVEKPLIAPITGRRCVHYAVEVAEWVKRMRRSDWNEIVSETKAIDFSIADATGTARIETQSFNASATQDTHTESEPYLDPPKRILALLKRHSRDAVDGEGIAKRFQYREGVLEIGEAVVVVGRARWEDAGAEESGDYRGQRRKRRLVIEAHDDPVRATDAPRSVRARA